MGRLEGKVAVVTGGASGIGKATVELFVAEGAKVVIGDILDDDAQKIEEAHGDAVKFIHTDVTQEDQIAAMIKLAPQHFGSLDILFNNAGFGGELTPIGEMTVEGFHVVADALILGVFLGMKHAAPIMKAQGSGSIINTASIAGLQSGFGPHIYSAAKAAVRHASRTVAAELAPYNIRVNAVCPGGIATPIFARGLDVPSQLIESSVAALEKGLAIWQPMPRNGRPEDIAEAVLFLGSDGSSFVTGQALTVDGGATLGADFPNFETGELGKFQGIAESMAGLAQEADT